VRTSWSRGRAWHKDEVTICVRARYVPDGAPVLLSILPKEHEDVFLHVVTGNIRGGALDYNYKVDWKDNPYLAPCAGEFKVQTRLDEQNLVEFDSNVLTVDLTPPVFSY
jgi:hypothetical protein